jgi:peptidoglycan/LPS O-acetylase OafA/YrhL
MACARALGESDRGEKARFVALDSWRGFCALLVALYHVPVTAFVFLNPLVRGSFLFVDFFFVLSGFVISFTYEGASATVRRRQSS